MKKYELLSALLEEYSTLYNQQLIRLLDADTSPYERILAATNTRMYLGSLQDVAGQLELALQNNTYVDDVDIKLVG